MQRLINSNKKQFCLQFNVRAIYPQRMRIQAMNSQKPYSYYYNTCVGIDANGKDFELMFPLSPQEMVVRIYPENFSSYENYIKYANPVQKNIEVTKTKVSELKTKPIWLSENDRSFIKFIERFSSNAPLYSATQADGVPSIYKSDNGKFTISYFDRIKNQNGTYVSTPARIAHDSGEIQVSKSDFIRYTIPGRMAILLHEYAHKYVNQRTGAKISDETRADLNAMAIYLSLGYSPAEALLVFLDVFEGANNEQNHKRFLVLRDYVNKFINGELTEYYKSLTNKNKA